jgi:hypothetical protein
MDSPSLVRCLQIFVSFVRKRAEESMEFNLYCAIFSSVYGLRAILCLLGIRISGSKLFPHSLLWEVVAWNCLEN